MRCLGVVRIDHGSRHELPSRIRFLEVMERSGTMEVIFEHENSDLRTTSYIFNVVQIQGAGLYLSEVSGEYVGICYSRQLMSLVAVYAKSPDDR